MNNKLTKFGIGMVIGVSFSLFLCPKRDIIAIFYGVSFILIACGLSYDKLKQN